jgi:hypothetical protein
MFFVVVGIVIVWFLVSLFLPRLGVTLVGTIYLIGENPQTWSDHPILFGGLAFILCIIAFCMDALTWGS